MDVPSNANYQPSIAGGENSRGYTMPTARVNGQAAVDPASANQLLMATRPNFYGGASQPRPGFPMAPIARPPFNFDPSAGKLGETGGPMNMNNAAPVSTNSVQPGAWRPNTNGILRPAVPPGGVVSASQFVPSNQQSMSYSRSPVPPSFQSPPSSGVLGTHQSFPSPAATGPRTQMIPVVGGGPSARFVGPPPRAGTPYQPVPTLPSAPPMMTMPQHMIRPVNSAPVSNNPTLPHTSGPSRPQELPVPFDGQRQYSHQVHAAPTPVLESSQAVTPSGSETHSQRSSRVPSPVNVTQTFDNLEGQFSSGPPNDASYQHPTAPASQIRPPSDFPVVSVLAPSAYAAAPGTRPPLQPYQGTPGMVPTYPPQPGMTQPGPGFVPTSNLKSPDGRGGNAWASMPPQPAARYPGMPPQPAASAQYPGMPPQPAAPSQYPGMPPQQAAPAQYPGMPPQPASSAQYPSMPPQPAAPSQYPGVPPQQVASAQYPGMPPQPAASAQYPGMPPQPAASAQYPGMLSNSFAAMNLQSESSRPVNLMQERRILPTDGIENVLPNLPTEFKKVNCSPDIMSCTLNTIPSTQSLLNKSRLPLGLLIHPFKDLSQLPVIQSSVIVRCRSCRTYINPFVTFVDSRRWKCNLCYRVNDLPEEFNYDPVSKTYGEPQRRPEIKSSTLEFIAPSEYMLRPPQPAVYLFLLDVSFNAIETGYLPIFCRTLLEELDHFPGDARTLIGFITYDSVLYFYGLDPEGSQQPQMFVVSDLEEVLLPTPDTLLVNLQEAKEMITDFLTKLPNFFEKNMQTGSALGPALQAAYKLMSPTGGRITVVQTQLPTIGAGALKSREESDERSGKKIQHLLPATDFYKKLSLDYSAQQIAVDMFMLNSQFADIATVGGVSKFSGGNIYYFPGFHTISNPPEAERFESTLHRYFTRKIGFESVMRIRCTKGLSIHTFHGNFFVRSTDLLSLPNINPDAGFGVQVSIEDNLDVNYVSFQAALLYTSSKAERRIRVHTLCLPVTTVPGDIWANANQQVIVGLLAKMGVDKSLSGSLTDAREAMINAVVDMLTSYRSSLSNPSQFTGQLPCPYQLRLIPLYVLALLKSTAFRIGTSTKLDDRIFAMELCKSMPLRFFIQTLHPNLYPVHMLDDKNAINRDDKVIPQPPLLPLSSAHVDRHGAYLMDTGSHMYLWLGAAISDQFCQEVLNCQCFQKVPELMTKLPALENSTLDRLNEFIAYLNEQRPVPATLTILREDSRMRGKFLQHLIEDRTESTLSYQEFLTHIQKEIKS